MAESSTVNGAGEIHPSDLLSTADRLISIYLDLVGF